VHTWVEYINRLATVVLGLPCAILFFLTIVYAIKNHDRIPMFWSGASMLMLLFEAWLGKLVVDGNLIENSITYHMLGSLVLILSLLALSHYLHPEKIQQAPKKLVLFSSVFVVLCFVQIIWGTQVREEIDVLNKSGVHRSNWIKNVSGWFYFHRSFSLLMLAVFVLWIRGLQHNNLFKGQAKWLVILLATEIGIGVVLSYLGMPIVAQPMHLFFGTALFTVALSWRFQTRVAV